MELLQKLGIHPALLIAQIINFIILLLILYKFLYNPVLAMMKKREDRIKKSIEDADEISRKLKEMEVRYDEKLQKAKQEAMAILEKAEKDGVKQKDDAVNKTKEEVANIVNKAKEQITDEKDKMVQEVKKEMGSLVVAAMEKVLTKEKATGIDKKSIEETVKNL